MGQLSRMWHTGAFKLHLDWFFKEILNLKREIILWEIKISLFSCILQSPTGFIGLLLDSTWTPHSPHEVPLDSSWSPHGVHEDSPWTTQNPWIQWRVHGFWVVWSYLFLEWWTIPISSASSCKLVSTGFKPSIE